MEKPGRATNSIVLRQVFNQEMAEGIKCVESFEPIGEPSVIAAKWERWKKSFQFYIAALGNVADARKKALLLHCGGQEIQDIFELFDFDGDVTQETCTFVQAIAKFDAHFAIHRNDTFERNVFRQMSQHDGESIAQYVTRLRQQAKFCNFGNAIGENIRDQVIDKLTDKRLKTELFKRQNLTLEILLQVAQVHEQATGFVNKMGACSLNESECDAVNFARSRGGKGARFKDRFKQTKAESRDHNKGQHGGAQERHLRSRTSCHRCGFEGHYASDPKCPARNELCNECNLRGHFKKMCKTKEKRKKVVRRVDEQNKDDSDDEHYVFGTNDNLKNEMIHVIVGGVNVMGIVDSGASCNMIDVGTWEKLKQNHIKTNTCSTEHNKKVFAYGSNTPLPIRGIFTANIQLPNQTDSSSFNAEFLVTEKKGVPLLSKETSMKLGVLHIGVPQANSTAYSVSQSDVKPEEKPEFRKLFTGLGKLVDHQVKLHVKPDSKPVIQNARRIPFSMRKKVEEKIAELEKLDIIESVDGPTHFQSPIVVVPKSSGDIRICVDMRQANESVERERFPMPTVEEVLVEMNGSKVFSKLDLNMGFHQLELEENSRDITTFTTHSGLYRYKRLMFGITSAPEIYQSVIQQTLTGIHGCRNMTDDIIIHAKTMKEHDEVLEKVLNRLLEKGLTLNKEKCMYRMNELTFMGFLLSERGVGPTEAKVQAVQNATRPTCASEVRSFLGLVNYNGRFIQNLATKSEPLRKLTRQNVPFVWTQKEEEAFQKLKDEISKAETLGYFDLNAEETRIIADASPVGLGAVLVQKQKGEKRVISYASRSLTDVERRYSQTEKEALALVWACERFHQYVYGIKFVLETDHRPLQFIYSKKSKPSARIERWVLRIQSYRFTVEYKPGPQNIADPLSRLMNKSKDKIQNETEEYVMFNTQKAIPKALSGREIEDASASDPELEMLRTCIKTGNWDSESCLQPSVKALWSEFSIFGQLVLRGTRIVIPKSLREQVIEIAHEGHQGIVKTKERLRCSVWWPGMDKDTEKSVRACHECQIVGQCSVPEPMIRTKMPNEPWHDVAVDLMGPLPNGENILVVVDYYSRFVEFSIMKSTTSEKVILELERIFSVHGLPLSMKTDNGPQFVSEEFENFLTENQIEHRTSIPLWPQANGEVERQNRSILKALKIANAEKKNLKRELYKYLLAYHSTPHQTTGVPPAELMFKRKIRSKLPQLESVVRTKSNEQVRDRDQISKQKGKEYADHKRHAKYTDIHVGDEVLLKQKKQDKLTTTFEAEPYKVMQKNGSEICIQSPAGMKYKRNVAHAKRYIQASKDDTSMTNTCTTNLQSQKDIQPEAQTERALDEDTGQTFQHQSESQGVCPSCLDSMILK